MRSLTWAAAAACLLAFAGSAARSEDAGKDSDAFFNGKDLTAGKG